MKPTVRVVALQQKCKIHAGSAPAATDLTTNPEEIVWALDGLEGSDELR